MAKIPRSISLEEDIWQEMDVVAAKEAINRSQLVSKAVKVYMSSTGTEARLDILEGKIANLTGTRRLQNNV